MSTYDPKQDLGAHLRFLGQQLDKATSFLRHVDSQANILIGISSGLFVLSLSLDSQSVAVRFSLSVLAVFSAASAISALLAVHPPRRLRKQGQEESLMYHRRVSNYGSAKKFEKALMSLSGDQAKFTHQYALEVYNIYRYTYQPKRRFFNTGRNLLLTGVLLALVFFGVLRLAEFINF